MVVKMQFPTVLEAVNDDVIRSLLNFKLLLMTVRDRLSKPTI